MKIIKSLCFVIFLIGIMPLVNALSLNGDQISPIIYEPGKNIENLYSISETNLGVDISLGGDQEILSYISTSELTDNEFSLNIKFPEDLEIDPGSYSFNLKVTEIQGEGAKVGSILSVARQFIVEVYSYEKAIQASLSAPSINQGSDVVFTLNVNSRTYSDIDNVNALISVFDQFGKKVGEVATESKSLESLSSISFSVPFNAKNLPLGDYRAQAVINYDGQQKIAEDDFKIGNLDVIVENYTSSVSRGFNDFVIQVRNNWGDGIKDVYAQLFIGENKILHTPSIDLGAWGTGELNAIGNFDLSPGKYPAILKIFFEGEQKDQQIMLEIIESEKGESDNLVLLILLSGLILSSILLSVMVYLKKRNKEDRL